MADMSHGEYQLRGLVLALGLRAAATAGALVALVSLLAHVPLVTACARGGATWLALVVLAHLTRWLVRHTWARRTETSALADKGTRG